MFCVSSRAFHKLKGRLEKDGAVRGFQDEDDTEIPQLVTHAKNLTIEARVKSSKNFLNEVKGLVNSLTMWITVGMDSLQLSGTEKKKEATEVEALLAHLREVRRSLVLCSNTRLTIYRSLLQPSTGLTQSRETR